MCIYLNTTEIKGQFFDLYVCPNAVIDMKMDTIVARYGDNGADYISGIDFAKRGCVEEEPYIVALKEALDLALKKGFK
jgi:hypothetical protein